MKHSEAQRLAWPTLTTYENEYLARVALPLGGIGTGTVSLGGRGDLRDWEIVNRPAKGFTPPHTFFALRTQTEAGIVQARALEGPLLSGDYEGSSGSPAANHGLPRFRSCRFEAAYPLGQVILSDPDVPLSVRLEAWNPLILPDGDKSGLPVAVLRYVLSNPTSQPVQASVCGSLQNFIGNDGVHSLAKQNVNTFHVKHEDHIAGVFCQTEGVPHDAETWGTMALSVVTNACMDVSHRTAWTEASWGGGLLDFWDDFTNDGRLDERPVGKTNMPHAGLCVRVTVPPGERVPVTFLLTWHFPNRMTWTPEGHPSGQWLSGGACESAPPLIGNYYTTRFADAWNAAQKIAPQLPELERETVQFVQAFCHADLPNEVKEAALFNLSTLRTQTVFRTPDGTIFGWEGCHDHHGSCFGSCTHVWNYEQTVAHLFGPLSRNFRETEFLYMTNAETGVMPFRVSLPFSTNGEGWGVSAADGQMGCLMKLFRDWKLSGDDAWLKSLWPNARKSLEFCWISGGWDADQDGVMEGCQHNTMDVEYFGPNGQMGAWYLGALRASEEMARYLGENDFADKCRRLFDNGSQWMDAHLFSGEYYPQHIAAPASADAIAPGLRHPNMGASDLSDPELQLGAGCLVDQLVGQYMAHVCGLGYLLQPENVQKALQSIYRYNFKADFWSHFNPMRSYVLGGESAVLMATYPHGNRPTRPFPYYNEVMTGFEYTAAVGMLQENQTEEGLAIIRAIRARYDGKKRSPFNEAECGHHYARAMAAWAAVLTLSGFDYDARTAALTLAAPPDGAASIRHFWSTGDAWGTANVSHETLIVSVGGGKIALASVVVKGGATPRVLTRARQEWSAGAEIIFS